MPIDAGIPLQVKQVEMPNPLDSAVKALTMKNLLQQNQSNQIKLTQEQREAADQQTVRDAFKDNSSQAPDGSPIVNRQGVMKDLMDRNPLLAQKQSLEFKQMDLDNLNRQHQIAKSILFDVTPGDQASVDRAFEMAKQNNLPPLDNVLPRNANDPNFGSALRQAQMKSLTAEEQLAQMNKQTEFQMQQQKNALDSKKLGVEMQHFDYGKKFEANQQVQSSIEGSRQADDAKQALKDVQAANKVNGLLSQAKDKSGNIDYNKLDNQQVRLLYGEVGKIAQGGAPTEGGLHEMTPETARAMLANYQSLATNKPVSAEMGEFIKKIKSYTDELGDQGKTLLRERENRIVDQRRDDLGEKNYQNFKSGIARTYGDSSAAEKAAGKDKAPAPDKKEAAGNYTSDVTSYAEKHGITPQQAAAIKAQRTKVAGP